MKNSKGTFRAIHFVYLPTNESCNCSRSGVNVRAHLLRQNFSRNYSSIRSGPLFPILVLLGAFFHFHKTFKRTFCKQTVENMIRRRILPMSHKRTLGVWANKATQLFCKISRVTNIKQRSDLIHFSS